TGDDPGAHLEGGEEPPRSGGEDRVDLVAMDRELSKAPGRFRRWRRTWRGRDRPGSHRAEALADRLGIGPGTRTGSDREGDGDEPRRPRRHGARASRTLEICETASAVSASRSR